MAKTRTRKTKFRKYLKCPCGFVVDSIIETGRWGSVRISFADCCTECGRPFDSIHLIMGRWIIAEELAWWVSPFRRWVEVGRIFEPSKFNKWKDKGPPPSGGSNVEPPPAISGPELQSEIITEGARPTTARQRANEVRERIKAARADENVPPPIEERPPSPPGPHFLNEDQIP